MSYLITEIEAATLIGGYYAQGCEAVKRRRIRKLINKAGIAYVEKDRQRSIDREDLPKLVESIEWQSNRIKGKILPTGGCVGRTRASTSSNLQAYFTPTKSDPQRV